MILTNWPLVGAASKYKNYIFNVPCGENEAAVNKIIMNQYNNDSSGYYSYLKANDAFVLLIKIGKIDIIKSLIYSPNYFYSVNAMEALIYLSAVNKIPIDKALKRKIEEVRGRTYEIIVKKGDDVFSHVNGYSDINMAENKIIAKNQNALR